MKGAKKRVEKFKTLKDGTYSAKTGQAVSYAYGFQFSFVRDEAFSQLNDESWDFLTEYLVKETGSEEYIGVYGGKAETSFFTKEKEIALQYATIFNQESILDWQALANGKSWEEYYILSPTYNESAKVDYVKIINEILQHEKKVQNGKNNKKIS